jgi:hypothetical protein
VLRGKQLVWQRGKGVSTVNPPFAARSQARPRHCPRRFVP